MILDDYNSGMKIIDIATKYNLNYAKIYKEIKGTRYNKVNSEVYKKAIKEYNSKRIKKERICDKYKIKISSFNYHLYKEWLECLDIN